MIDRFRFKFWDKTCKNIVYPSEDLIYKTENSRLDISGMLCSERFIPLQCTGLKDKNDKLVYFDDLVRLPDGVIGKVAQIRDIDNNDYGRVVILPVANILNKVYHRFYVPTMIKYSEIIGNIYENPKLLEEKQC